MQRMSRLPSGPAGPDRMMRRHRSSLINAVRATRGKGELIWRSYMPQNLDRQVSDPAVGGDRRRRGRAHRQGSLCETDPHLNFGKPLETAGRKARGLRRSRYMWRYVSPAADHKGKLPETAGRRAMGLRPLRSVLSISKGLCQPVADRSANRWKQRDAKLRGLRCLTYYASPAAGDFASDMKAKKG